MIYEEVLGGSDKAPHALKRMSASTVDGSGGGKTVAILLSTFNGEKYLAEQLDSIASQTYADWMIIASDDGSKDSTISILESYQERFGEDRLKIVYGPGRGFAANFLSMAAGASISASYYAFCDQDDIWHSNKLERALVMLQAAGSERPAMYCSRTRLVDEFGRPLGYSPLFQRRPSFNNALVQSLAGGNTMVFNDAARGLIRSVGVVPIVSHDWWVYLLVTACEGLVVYDSRANIDYRQHGANLIGANSRLSDRLYRIKRMVRGDFRAWSEINLGALGAASDLLSTASRATLRHFASARDSGLLRRSMGFFRSGIYRQTLLGNLGLVIAALMGRI